MDRGEIDILYCPAEEMLRDFHSKPLQGGLFRKFRDRIMNCDGSHSIVAKLASEDRSAQSSPRSVLYIERETEPRARFGRENMPGAGKTGSGYIRPELEQPNLVRAQSMRGTGKNSITWADAVGGPRRRTRQRGEETRVSS